jgi:competence protein ComEC
MQINFSKLPALQLLIFSLVGFFLQKLVPITINNYVIYFITIFIFIFIAIFLKKKNIFVITLFIAFGAYSSFQTNFLDYRFKNNFHDDLNGIFVGKITDELKSDNKTSRFIVQGDLYTVNNTLLKNLQIHLTLVQSEKKNIKFNIGDAIYGKVKYHIPNKATLPNEFDERNYMKNLKVSLTAYCFSNDMYITQKATKISISENIKNTISTKIDELFSKLTAPIVKALILGDKTEIPQEIRQNFALSGTAHILAVSGLHVGIIAAIIFWLFSFVNIDWLKFFLFSTALWCYNYLIDFQPSAVRASLMITLYIFAKVIQRKPDPINIIALTCLLLLIFNPTTLYSAGFQMSIASITGIILLNPIIQNFFNNILNLSKIKLIGKTLATSLSITFSASIIVSPIVAYYFDMYSIISPLTNIFVVFFMVNAQIFAIFAIFLSFLFFPLAYIYAVCSQLLIELSELVTYFCAKVPYAYLSGGNTKIISILISLFLIYIFNAKNYNQLAFKSIVVAISILIIFTFPNNNNNTIQVYERAYSSVIELPRKDLSLIIDKFNNQTNLSSKYDYGLLNYIKTKSNNNLKKIYFFGNAAKLIKNKLPNASIEWIELNKSELEELRNKLKLNF